MLQMLQIIFIFLSFTIALNDAHCATSTETTYVTRPHNETKSSQIRRHRSINISVVNILIDRIENNVIYAKDGRVFTLNESIRIINNHNLDSRVHIGELFFEDGKLSTIIIK
jgi:hypothetical protein